MEYDYLIVGAGLYGAVCAHELNKSGKNCLVIDRRDHMAGNIFTEKKNDIEIHKYGAHIFHTSDEEVWKYVNRFAKFNSYINSPIAMYKDELYNLPFNMNTFAKMWNVKTPIEAKQIIQKQIKEAGISTPSNLEEQAISLVGVDVYEKLIKGYTEKQWGRECKELPSFIIKRLPLRFVFDNNYFNDLYQGIPENGYTEMIQSLLGDIPVLLQKSYEDIVKDNSIKYRKLIFTGRIDEYFHFCYGALEYRSLRFEEEYLPECDNFQGNAVVNYTEANIPYTRIIEHKHFAKTECEGTVITREYPEVFKEGKEPYYSVNDEANMNLYHQYKTLAEAEKNVYFGGRLGCYQYYDMDKVIRSALDFVKELINE